MCCLAAEHGQLYCIDRHLSRFERSAQKAGIALAFSTSEIRNILVQVRLAGQIKKRTSLYAFFFLKKKKGKRNQSKRDTSTGCSSFEKED